MLISIPILGIVLLLGDRRQYYTVRRTYGTHTGFLIVNLTKTQIIKFCGSSFESLKNDIRIFCSGATITGKLRDCPLVEIERSPNKPFGDTRGGEGFNTFYPLKPLRVLNGDERMDDNNPKDILRFSTL